METVQPKEPPDETDSNKYLSNASAALSRVMGRVSMSGRIPTPSAVWTRASRYLALALPAFCFRVDDRSSRVAPSDVTSHGYGGYGSSRFYTNPLMVRPHGVGTVQAMEAFNGDWKICGILYTQTPSRHRSFRFITEGNW